LFSSVIYSVLAVLILLLFALGFIFFSIDAMKELYAFFFGKSAEAFDGTTLSLALVLILMAIYALIQMLRRKRHGMYLFFALSVLVVFFIFQTSPLDLINMIMIFVVNFVFYINRGWFKEPLNEPPLEETESEE
jgi:hypothetical protein